MPDQACMSHHLLLRSLVRTPEQVHILVAKVCPIEIEEARRLSYDRVAVVRCGDETAHDGFWDHRDSRRCYQALIGHQRRCIGWVRRSKAKPANGRQPIVAKLCELGCVVDCRCPEPQGQE